MENKEPLMWPHKDQSDRNGCLGMLCCFGVIIFVALCWASYELFK